MCSPVASSHSSVKCSKDEYRISNKEFRITKFPDLKDGEAFDKLCEFCERVALSFRPFAKETGKLFRLATDPKTVGLLNGILLPAIKLMNPNITLSKICDVAAIASTLAQYSVPRNRPVVGFEYLENLSRRISLKRLQKTISCLVPKLESCHTKTT